MNYWFGPAMVIALCHVVANDLYLTCNEHRWLLCHLLGTKYDALPCGLQELLLWFSE